MATKRMEKIIGGLKNLPTIINEDEQKEVEAGVQESKSDEAINLSADNIPNNDINDSNVTMDDKPSDNQL
jgi:hypothetical protein